MLFIAYEFRNYLENEGILEYPNFSQGSGIVNNFADELGIDSNFNDKEEVVHMTNYFSKECGINIVSLFPGMITLCRKLKREKNVFECPSSYRCKAVFFNNHFFASNGKVYICDCIQEDKGVIGTYYPIISHNYDVINDLAYKIPIFYDEKCKSCVYKYVCLGGCPLMARVMNKKAVCGPFADKELLDNLSCIPIDK